VVNGEWRRRRAGGLFILAWVLWLHRWGPAFLVLAFVAWMILHNRLEAGLGERLGRLWRRAWPLPRVVLIALACASTLVFAWSDARATVKALPVALDVVGLSMLLVGDWRPRFTLPEWLGGDTRSPSVRPAA
jgi:hypothetical protein